MSSYESQRARDKLKEYQRAYYEANKERIREQRVLNQLKTTNPELYLQLKKGAKRVDE